MLWQVVLHEVVLRDTDFSHFLPSDAFKMLVHRVGAEKTDAHMVWFSLFNDQLKPTRFGFDIVCPN